MKRLRTADLETGNPMAFSTQPQGDHALDRQVSRQVQRLIHQATHARSRGNDAVADALLREARALTAEFTQYQRALDDAMTQLVDLQREGSAFWERLADDRTLHDLADDACVLMTLLDDLDQATVRLIALECTRP